MKNLIRVGVLLLFVAGIAMSTTSCKKDKCYECSEYTDINGDTQPAIELCEDELGGSIATDLAVTAQRALGATCTER